MGPHEVIANVDSRSKLFQPIDRDPVGRVQWGVAVDAGAYLARFCMLARDHDGANRRYDGDDAGEEQVDSDVEAIDRAHFDSDGDEADGLPCQGDDGQDEQDEGEDTRECVDGGYDGGRGRGEDDDATSNECELERDEVAAELDEGIGETAEFHPFAPTTPLNTFPAFGFFHLVELMNGTFELDERNSPSTTSKTELYLEARGFGSNRCLSASARDDTSRKERRRFRLVLMQYQIALRRLTSKGTRERKGQSGSTRDPKPNEQRWNEG